MRYEVQTYTIADGWKNCWQTNDEFETFNSFKEALEELDAFLESVEDSYLKGYMEDRYDRKDFRIKEIA